jgi:hypothetical protein
MWRFEHYAVSLPALAVEARDGLVKLAYRTPSEPAHSVEEIKRHFESAIHREHSEIKVEWLWTESAPPARAIQPQILTRLFWCNTFLGC